MIASDAEINNLVVLINKYAQNLGGSSIDLDELFKLDQKMTIAHAIACLLNEKCEAIFDEDGNLKACTVDGEKLTDDFLKQRFEANSVLTPD